MKARKVRQCTVSRQCKGKPCCKKVRTLYRCNTHVELSESDYRKLRQRKRAEQAILNLLITWRKLARNGQEVAALFARDQLWRKIDKMEEGNRIDTGKDLR